MMTVGRKSIDPWIRKGAQHGLYDFIINFWSSYGADVADFINYDYPIFGSKGMENGFFGLISLCLASAFVAQTYTATVQSIERKENVKRAENIFKSPQRDIYINGEPVSENFNPDAINLV